MVDQLGGQHAAGAALPNNVRLEDFPADVVQRLRDELALNDADLKEVVQAINDGVRSPGEFVGVSEADASHLEDMAVGLYRAKQYQDAAYVFLTVCEMFPRRLGGWRGAGAALQAMRLYPGAIVMLLRATNVDPNDLITTVLLGECFCFLNRQDMGVQYMQ
ncbi:MAG: hypothetical protein EOO40_08985, partial [Deltaproteobacteria bacterium]